MNALIGLCHFCEAHGPRPVFCTFTTVDESDTTEASKRAVQCSGCTSVGPDTVFVSRDDNGIIFCSRESVPNSDVTAFLRQAALRSITCEVNWSKEGGVVYFSDAQGHVLSLMFQLRDTRARGLKRLFSIVVLMKDKMLLLNITPVLSEHMQKIAKELQVLADVVYENEQSICSQRALRLKTGRNDFGQSRSLIQLTDSEEIFKKLHSHFTWMLRTGAATYSETLYTSQDLLKKLTPNTNSIFNENACSVPKNENMSKYSIILSVMSIRELQKLLGEEVFRVLLFCTLTGIDIVIKSQNTDPSSIITSLSSLVPSGVDHNISHIRADSSVRVLPSQDVCILEETENGNFDCKWSHSIPTKCPTLMKKIENAMENTKFNDTVLHQHIKSLQLEWLGIARTLKTALLTGKPDAVKNLEQVLGVTKQDESLVNYWARAFCD